MSLICELFLRNVLREMGLKVENIVCALWGKSGGCAVKSGFVSIASSFPGLKRSCWFVQSIQSGACLIYRLCSAFIRLAHGQVEYGVQQGLFDSPSFWHFWDSR